MMRLFQFLKEVYYKVFPIADIEKAFKIQLLVDEPMQKVISNADRIYSGIPPWLEKNLKTLNFQKIIPSEVARLSTLELDVSISGSPRTDYINDIIKNFKKNIRCNLEYGLALGGIALKPNSVGGVDFVAPPKFLPTSVDGNGNIMSAIFLDFIQRDDKIYTKAEYHHFEHDVYYIENKAFQSNSSAVLGMPIPLSSLNEWSNVETEVKVNGLVKPLFGYFKVPHANSISMNSPLGLPITYGSIQQIIDLDIAYTRFSDEIEDSQKVTVIERSMCQTLDSEMVAEVPRYFVPLSMANTENIIKEINPTLQPNERITGINHYLSLIGFQCGFSEGYFVFNEKTGGITTATQVEADRQRTAQLIADVRSNLQIALDNLIYAIDKYIDLYTNIPAGKYEVSYYFKDINQSFEEDRQRFYNLAMAGKYPWRLYYVKYEGYSEEEAKEIIEETSNMNAELGFN